MTVGDARKRKACQYGWEGECVDNCPGCTNLKAVKCPGRDRCLKIGDLFDHDWAGDWQLGDAIVETCRKCELWPEGRKADGT